MNNICESINNFSLGRDVYEERAKMWEIYGKLKNYGAIDIEFKNYFNGQAVIVCKVPPYNEIKVKKYLNSTFDKWDKYVKRMV